MIEIFSSLKSAIGPYFDLNFQKVDGLILLLAIVTIFMGIWMVCLFMEEF